MKTKGCIDILEKHEASAVRFLENIVWESADGYRVTDVEGVTRIDFSSGAMITNSGHNNSAIINAIISQLQTGIYSSYLFPNKPRCQLHQILSKIIPENYQSILLNTGAEGIENALKIARIYGNKILKNKGKVISFKNSFHGKTLASTAISGIESNKYWISSGILNELSLQVPFPDCLYEPNTYTFANTVCFIESSNIDLKDICAFFIEPYQGQTHFFLSEKYAYDLQKWCRINRILLICDEVQSGIGRTGKMWGYEHLGIVPDIFIAGKGLAACLPISAVFARKDLFELCEKKSFNTTHSGNPICCVAAHANINFILENCIIEHTEKMGILLESRLKDIQKKIPWLLSFVVGKGLAYAIHINIEFKYLMKDIRRALLDNGLLLMSSGGVAGCVFKLVPPLIIDENGINKGCDIIEKSLLQVIYQYKLSQ